MLAALLGGLILSGLAIYAGMLLARLKRQQGMQSQAIAARKTKTHRYGALFQIIQFAAHGLNIIFMRGHGILEARHTLLVFRRVL